MKGVYHYGYLDDFHREEFQRIGEKNYYRTAEPSSVRVDGGVVLPYRKEKGDRTASGGVLDRQGRFVAFSAQHLVGEDITCGYTPEKVEESERKVIYFGAFHAHWGHFLTEMVTRCWYLCGQIDWSQWYVAYIRKSDTCDVAMDGSFREFLELLGVPADRILQVELPTRFASVIVPEPSNHPGQDFTDAYVRIFDTVRDRALAGGSDKARRKPEGDCFEKIYFTRQKSRGLRNTQIGERGICRMFRKNGYRVVAPERLSLTEQVRLLGRCRELAVIEGTLFHNILFAQNGIRLTVINRVCGANAYQPFINQARDADVTYVDAHLSLFPVFAGGPFLLYKSKALLRYAGDRGFVRAVKGEGAFKLHGRLLWYFLRYLEQMKPETIVRWNLREKFGDTVLEQYRFYRGMLEGYDSGVWVKLRKGLCLLLKGLVDG